MNFIRKTFIGLVATVIFGALFSSFAANAQRVIPAGETTGSPGTYVNIGQAPYTATAMPTDAVNGGLMTNGIVRLWNGTGFDAWRSSAVNTAVTTQTGVGAVTYFQGTTAANNIAAATTVKASAGRLFRVSVVVAGAAGVICDNNGACAAANIVGALPAVVGTYEFNWPMLTGIRVEPGAGQTVAITYQ